MKTIAALAGMAVFLAATPSIAATGDAPETSAATLQPSDWTWNDTGAQGPISVVVSLPDQRAYVASHGGDPKNQHLVNLALFNDAVRDKPAGMHICVHMCRGNHRSSWVASGRA